MKQIVAFMVLLSFLVPVPVRAGINADLEPVEKNLIEQQKKAEKKQLEEEMNREYRKKQAEQPVRTESKVVVAGERAKEGSSNWWKWALGVLVVGGIAAAAGGGGGGSGENSSSSSSGAATATW